MPAFVHTKVDPDRLSVTADNIDNSLKMVENALSTVKDSLNNTLQPTWSGIASTQFYSKYAVDTENFTMLLKKLRALNEQLRQAAGIYDKADVKACELVNGLRIG